jgi:hypothetical protein
MIIFSIGFKQMTIKIKEEKALLLKIRVVNYVILHVQAVFTS